MVRKLLLLGAGLGLLVLGLIGLLVPVLPGVLLLAAAAGCFSLASRRFRVRLEHRLQRHPRYRLALRQWRAARGLSFGQRLRLGFWLTLGSLLPAGRG